MISKKLFDGKVCRRSAIITALGAPCFLAANANAKPFGFFGSNKDSFKDAFDACMGVPMAQFVNTKLRAFDKSEIGIRMAYPLVSDGRWPIIICSVDDNADPISYDLMVGTMAAKGYFVILVMPSDVMPPNSKASKITNNTRRAQQVRFTLDKIIEVTSILGDVQKRIDFDTIGIAGHGEGAWTALELIGWNRMLLPNSDLADGRIRGAYSLMPTPVSSDDENNTNQRRQIIYGRTMIAGDLDSFPDPPTGSGVIGLDLPSKSSGFGGLLGRIRGKKREDKKHDEQPQREILATACVAAGYFFDWSLKGKKDKFNEILSMNGKEIPSVGKKIRVVRA
ncbi:MAG: hypothetical protein J0L55_01595 [Caulobacterales bacterium]|nr:hypothetical protein [Caulobacterales bacterium]MCA0373984.1 hypothetical protein [Pseudomonadota bacterium]